uniref:Receptor L-domain domain-containing protein n=1 Tax=Seriola lalandi dorsalis TaxID=1841481 RepID=A0A3B4WFV0_SERLL
MSRIEGRRGGEGRKEETTGRNEWEEAERNLNNVTVVLIWRCNAALLLLLLLLLLLIIIIIIIGLNLHIYLFIITNQLTLLGTRENHYDNMVRMYSNCSVVMENLEVTYALEHQDLSFLQSIQEVSGYVLIAMNEAATVPLVNLRLIRGQNLYEGQFALLVMSNYNRNLSSATLNYTSGLRQLQLTMKSKELSIDLCNKTEVRRRSGQRYKTVYKSLRVPRRTVASITVKLKKFGTSTLPNPNPNSTVWFTRTQWSL